MLNTFSPTVASWPNTCNFFVTCVSSDTKVGYRPASFLGPTKFRSPSTFDSGNPLRTSSTGNTANPRGRLMLLQRSTRCGASHASGPRASGRITGFSMLPKNVLKSFRLPNADDRVYDATIWSAPWNWYRAVTCASRYRELPSVRSTFATVVDVSL